MQRFTLRSAILVGLFCLTVSTPASAGSLALNGTFWDTDQAGDTFGGGIAFAFPVAPRLDIELRASYYEELTNEGLDDLFEEGESIFVDNGLEITPLEIGLRLHLAPRGAARLYVMGGGGYYLLDSNFGDPNDEFGYYAGIGSSFGDEDGAAFFVEALYRKVEGSVDVDPDDFDEIDELEFNDSVAFDLDGVVINAGVVFRF